MWTLMLVYFLGLNIHQATTQENSTQMYFVTLKIDKNAITNVSQILSTPFVSNASLQVKNVTMTTICEGAVCHCRQGYRWSDAICKNQSCCGNQTCNFHRSPAPTCISEDTVSVSGSITLRGLEYQDCLAENTKEIFKKCHSNLTTKMKSVYSTLTGFDSLTINSYSVGSVVAHFEMTVVFQFEPSFLKKLTEDLVVKLNSTCNLETTGVAHISRPPNPLKYNSSAVLTCTVPTNVNTRPQWKIQKHKKHQEITNGTEATIFLAPLETTVTLTNMSELWNGEYSCLYVKEKNSVTISHKATTIVDVCLNQNIQIITTPAFPRCDEESNLKKVTTKCTLKKTHENYTVEWTTENIVSQLKELKLLSTEHSITYSAETYVSCAGNGKPRVICTFTNRCNQTSTGTSDIIIISVSDSKSGNFCKADGAWQETKAGYKAFLVCDASHGWRQRECTKGAKWLEEESMCINQDLHGVQQSAAIADSGLGALDTNAAEVFSQFKTVTNNTKSINSVANINTSVDVLKNLHQKLNDIKNDTTADDLLQTSSNLLEGTLESSWKQTKSKAGQYLESVECLIARTNLTKSNRKTNLELDVSDHKKRSAYENKVFNINISVTGSNLGRVKTAGFKNLERYFPDNDGFETNSIIVSTTTERKICSNFRIRIKFDLQKPRPRNTMLQCVYWNKSRSRWLTDGCRWTGPSNEGECECTHLSSFTILLSKVPLEIPWMLEITYVGLAVSVVSLIISLLIQVIVWARVVESSGLYFRYTAQVNICLCLLIANICFLASSKPHHITHIWCQTFVVLKHFFYLSMFFWVLCLSSTLLHQTLFPFHKLSKKNYLKFSIVLGYVCPLIIVVVTVLTNNAGADGSYFSKDTCWLIYSGPMKGSLHTFLIPMGIIIFISVFSMLVVIMKLLGQSTNTDHSNQSDKNAAKTIVRTVVLLTPIFGVTWILGFGVTSLDLTHGTVACVVNYAFTVLNSFQGLFILLTINLGERSTREALMNYIMKTPLSLTAISSKAELTSSSSLKK